MYTYIYICINLYVYMYKTSAARRRRQKLAGRRGLAAPRRLERLIRGPRPPWVLFVPLFIPPRRYEIPSPPPSCSGRASCPPESNPLRGLGTRERGGSKRPLGEGGCLSLGRCSARGEGGARRGGEVRREVRGDGGWTAGRGACWGVGGRVGVCVRERGDGGGGWLEGGGEGGCSAPIHATRAKSLHAEAL